MTKDAITASMWLSFRLNRQGGQAECLLEDALPGWLQMTSAELDAYQVPIYNSLGYLTIGIHVCTAAALVLAHESIALTWIEYTVRVLGMPWWLRYM
jgi:hypothetical protein